MNSKNNKKTNNRKFYNNKKKLCFNNHFMKKIHQCLKIIYKLQIYKILNQINYLKIMLNNMFNNLKYLMIIVIIYIIEILEKLLRKNIYKDKYLRDK